MKINSKPSVSVIIPVYNGSAFVDEAIQSILDQTYKKLELVIVNDGSTDETLAILKRFKDLHPRKIKVISYVQNLGESAAANIGFAASRGEFIARMDADDISYPDRISKQVTFMTANPGVVVVGSQADVISEKGEIIGKKTFPQYHPSIYRDYGFYHPMMHPSCMFRCKLLPYKNRLWENSHEPNDDYYTLFGLLRFGKFANLPESLIAYRLHGNNKSLQNARKKVFSAMRVRKDAILNFGYRPGALAVMLNLAQLIGALILPERLIVPAYLLMRGMNSPTGVLNRILTQFRRVYSLTYVSRKQVV
ncbi:MAG: glycosyltransferase [bacterium]|nr:glycosyltransferase [bacterium]